MRYAFAGDRQISVNLLKFLISKGHKPLALMVNTVEKGSHRDELISIAGLPKEFVFEGNQFRENLDVFKPLNLDYIFGIHFPYIIPSDFLNLPKIGFLNLHPAFLPFNKGWHTPSWAILDGTDYGATLHYMSEKLDEGDIIHQKKVAIDPEDTANSLYQKVLKAEEDVFIEAFDDLVKLAPNSIKQQGEGTSYVKRDLEKVQEITLDKQYTGAELIDKLRALTTNKIEESAYYVVDGKRYHIQVSIEKEK